MPRSHWVRVWNARRGLARAARQLADQLNADFDQPTVDAFNHLVDNFDAARQELHEADQLIRPTPREDMPVARFPDTIETKA